MASNASLHPPRRPVPAPSNEVLLESQKQWYFTDEELTRTPSILDGMSLETEQVQRSKGVNFIVQVGIMLKLPQLTLTAASVFLHRFFVRHSMVDLPRRPGLHPYSVAAGCLFLASKVDENTRKIKEFVIACCRVAQKNNNLEVDEQSKEFWRWKDTLIAYEDMCLEALCFDLQLEQPHKICYQFLCYFGKDEHKGLRNAAWAFLNDSSYTVLCLQFYPRTIAAAALWAAARLCNVAFEDDEEGRSWWEQLDVNLSEVRRAVSRLVELYERNITVHRQSHEYPTLPMDSDSIQEATRLVNPNPHGLSESTSTGEPNGRKRSREVEENLPQRSSSPTRRLSSYESNSTRERSPKRQRVTPDPSRTSIPAESPRRTSGGQRSVSNGHHRTSRVGTNSLIPSAASTDDSAHRRRQQQHPLPLPPPPPPPPPPLPPVGMDGIPSGGPVDAVQQRIDEIVQQGMARNEKLDPNRNDPLHPPNRHRERERDRDRDRDRDKDRYKDYERHADRERDRDRDWDQDRDRDRERDRHRVDRYEAGEFRDRRHGRDSINNHTDRDRIPPPDRRLSAESSTPQPRRSSINNNNNNNTTTTTTNNNNNNNNRHQLPVLSSSSSTVKQKDYTDGETYDDNEEGEITDDNSNNNNNNYNNRTDGTFGTSSLHQRRRSDILINGNNNSNADNERENIGNMDGDDYGGGSEEGEL